MLVRCMKNKIASLDDPVIRAHVEQHVHMDSIELAIGNCYPVFGVIFRAGVVWYLLCEEITDNYPTPYCSAFFELIDGAISSGWSLSVADSNVGSVSVLPDRWAVDGRFLEKLVDGESDAVSYFNDLKAAEANRNRLRE